MKYFSPPPEWFVCLARPTCTIGEAEEGSGAAGVTRSWLRYALSRAGEPRCSAKTPQRSGLPASAICTEPRGGSNKGELKGGGGGGGGGVAGGEGGRRGPKQTCPTTHSGRKQFNAGFVSAEETSCGRVGEDDTWSFYREQRGTGGGQRGEWKQRGKSDEQQRMVCECREEKLREV